MGVCTCLCLVRYLRTKNMFSKTTDGGGKRNEEGKIENVEKIMRNLDVCSRFAPFNPAPGPDLC